MVVEIEPGFADRNDARVATEPHDVLPQRFAQKLRRCADWRFAGHDCAGIVGMDSYRGEHLLVLLGICDGVAGFAFTSARSDDDKTGDTCLAGPGDDLWAFIDGASIGFLRKIRRFQVAVGIDKLQRQVGSGLGISIHAAKIP